MFQVIRQIAIQHQMKGQSLKYYKVLPSANNIVIGQMFTTSITLPYHWATFFPCTWIIATWTKKYPLKKITRKSDIKLGTIISLHKKWMLRTDIKFLNYFFLRYSNFIYIFALDRSDSVFVMLAFRRKWSWSMMK